MKNRSVTVSAPGKIHLLGEHSVVYGKPALLTAINKRLTVTLSPSKTNTGFTLEGQEKTIAAFQNVIEETIKDMYKLKTIPPYTAFVSSNIPLGYGLGSSAALSAAATAALLTFLDIPWDEKSVFNISYLGEKHFHGNPSGGDLATVIEGGLLYFRKEFEFLKSFSPLPFATTIENFLIIDSGKPTESTKEMVAKVGDLEKNFPKQIAEIFNKQEVLTKQLVLAFKESDEQNVMTILKQGEENLEKLGVVSKKSQGIIRSIEKLGGASKISGAGGYQNGSGMLLAYHSDPEVIYKFAKINNLNVEKIQIEKTGLRQENI